MALERQPEITPQPKAIAQKQPVAPAPVQKTQSIKTATQQTPTNQLANQVVTQPSAPTSQSGSANQSSDNLRQLLGGIRDSRATQGNSGSSGTGTGNGIGNGNGTGTGSGNGTGSGFGTGPGTGTGTSTGTGTITNNQPANPPIVATAPTPPKINTSSTNGRAACREGGCAAKYPQSAQRRGIQGRVEVAVDTDAQGNVTNVRIARSSGNRELDEETKRQARNWKLKPSEGGRQGVAIATEYVLRNDRRRYEQVQERKRQREARERNQQTTASNANTTEGTSRRRRLVTSSSTNIPAERSTESRLNRRLRRQPVQTAATNSSSQQRTTRSQGNVRDSLRGVRRQRVSNNSSQPTQTTSRRRRRDNSTSSQNKLRQSLRRLRQPSQSQPAGSQ